MPKFIGLHSLPGFTREMLAMVGQEARDDRINLLRVHGDPASGRIICEVEARDRDTFISWLNKINMPYDEVCKVELEMSNDQQQGVPAIEMNNSVSR